MRDVEQHTRGKLNTIEWTSGDGQSAERFVVLCHGFGAPGDDLVGIGEMLSNAVPSTRWVFPAAPLAPADMAGWGGRAWWQLRLAELAAKFESGNDNVASVMEQIADEEPDGLDDARTMLSTAVAESREDYLDIPFVLGGFSQGAMLTADTAGRGLLEPDAMVFFSGCAVGSSAWQRHKREAVPAVVTHGHADTVLPFAGGEVLNARLVERVGCSTTFVPFDGGHEIPRAALIEAANLIASASS